MKVQGSGFRVQGSGRDRGDAGRARVDDERLLEVQNLQVMSPDWFRVQESGFSRPASGSS